MAGPKKRNDFQPRPVRVVVGSGPYARVIVMFIDEDWRLALQVEDPEGGAEILLDIIRLREVISHLSEFERQMIEQRRP